MSKVNKNTEAKEISDIPKCSANTKSDCPHTTAAAPTSACKIKKKRDKITRNFVSLLCPIVFHAQMII